VDLEKTVSGQQDYSALDRTLHRLAFSGRAIQLAAADMERTLHGKRYRSITLRQPLFITSLPRAGTTLLLEIFSRIPGMATHRYRDMPFIMAPLLWDRISRQFRKQSVLKERAHGDGMQVGFDSPEAFEEVLWHAFWPKHYQADHIVPWERDAKAGEFAAFFREHMQKIIALRAPGSTDGMRYVSKNNANIARLALLRRLFPDASIVVPFRDPLNHAASMLRQHRNFLARHRSDPFSKQYMQDIGHFEFGQLHRPIRFGRPLTGDSETIEYWLQYWISAFEPVLATQAGVELVSFEQLCAGGGSAFDRLAARVGIDPASYGDDIAALFRAPPDYHAVIEVRDATLQDQAAALHRQLLERSVI
jgi:hypothetical protein